jgi:hypothetical protein
MIDYQSTVGCFSMPLTPEMLLEEQCLIAELIQTAQEVSDALVCGRPPGWWMRQRALIVDQHQRIRDMRDKHLRFLALPSREQRIWHSCPTGAAPFGSPSSQSSP